MKRWLFPAALLLSGAALAAEPAGLWTGNVNLVFGAKNFHDEFWKPVDSQPGFGVMLDARQEEWPLGLAVDYFYSGDSGASGGVKKEADVSELNLGIRKVWRATRTFRPFLGVGTSLAYAKLEMTANGVSASDSDSGAGVWVGGGLYWTLARALNVGFLYKHSTAKVTLLDERLDAGGNFFGTLVGLAW